MRLEKIKYKVNSTWENMLNNIFPVGIVQIRFDTTDPSELYGGQWDCKNALATNNSYLIGTGVDSNSTLGTAITGNNWNYTINLSAPSYTDQKLTETTIGNPQISLATGSGTFSHQHTTCYFTDSSVTNAFQIVQGSVMGTNYSGMVKSVTGGSNGLSWTSYGQGTTANNINNRTILLTSAASTVNMTHSHGKSGTYMVASTATNPSNYGTENNIIYKIGTTTNSAHRHTVTTASTTLSNQLPPICYCCIWERTS